MEFIKTNKIIFHQKRSNNKDNDIIIKIDYEIDDSFLHVNTFFDKK